MALRPEDITQQPRGIEPKEDARVDTSPEVAPTIPEAPPTVLPLVDYDLIKVPAEAERRASLLSRVIVDTNGVAHCGDDRSDTETLLAAVRVNDDQVAILVPLVVGKDQLLFPLPPDKPSRIGFFIGYASTQTVAAVLRMGLYPSVPLATQAISDAKNEEIMRSITGIVGNDADVPKWAEQVELYSTLGFNRFYSRGIFSKSHRPNTKSDTWQDSPLVILPDELLDMVKHYDPMDVKKDEFQVLFYGIKNVPNFPQFPNALYHPSTPSVFGSPLRTKGLGIGFGEAVSRRATTSSVDIGALRGAFKIIVIPR